MKGTKFKINWFRAIYIYILCGICLASCTKNDQSPPTVSTTSVNEISYSSASSGGTVTSQGGSSVNLRGICWDTLMNPTTEKSITKEFLGLGSFSAKLTNLKPGTLYYVRAYATNSNATGYGNEISFRTLDIKDAVDLAQDADGNIYHLISIGSQVWMQENLKTTKYNDGVEIPNVKEPKTWISLTTGAYTWYNNSSYYKDNGNYGALYNWYSVNTGKLCPVGFHVPSDLDWEELRTFSGGVNVAGDKLKESGTEHWKSPNEGATNETCFTALPGGCIWEISYWMGEICFFWSSTSHNDLTARVWHMTSGSHSLFGGETQGGKEKQLGYSVRCIKDN